VIMKDTDAPGVIYAAGVNTETYANPYSPSLAVNDPNGFFEPRLMAYGNAAATAAPELYYGPPTAAAFPEKGGDVGSDAQRDVVGGTKVVAIKDANGNTVYKKVPQYYQPWLLSNSAVTPSAGASILGAGVFAPVGTQIASQTAWWIQYGSFQQGFLSAGGNVSVLAGRNMLDVSVSAPTTGRVTGGLSANSTPVTHLYGGGNMVVRAGRDIRGGSFYEGSGHASIVAGGDIGQNDYVYRYANSTLKLPNLPLLAVDTGVVGPDAEPPALQSRGGVFHLRPAVAVDNAALAALILNVTQQLIGGFKFLHQRVANIGAVKAADLDQRILHMQQVNDVVAGGFIRGRGQRHYR